MFNDNVLQKSYILTHLSVTSPKPLESVELLVNGLAVETEWQGSRDGELHRAITDLTTKQLGGTFSSFSLRIHSTRFRIKREQKILVDIAEHLSTVQINEGQTYTISKNYMKNVVTITVQQDPTALASVNLRPTTEQITSSCPRFRILIIGNSGVGKSSLINMVFGLSGKEDAAAKVSALHVGEADINKEIKPSENVRLVLHDSRGFEGGETNNVETVIRFIQSRNTEPKLQDKLHAVWLCIQIPSSGGAVAEAGVEKLLKRKADGELGDVLFVVVFTQYDTLISQVEYEFIEGADGRDRMNASALKLAVSKKADELFLVNCLQPFKAKAGTKFPYSRVSTATGYENTVHELVNLTVAKLESALPLEPYITSVMAQHFSPKIKIQGSIEWII